MSSKPFHILFLSAWYPNRTYPTFGIFVKRHAQAAAIQNKINVTYVCSDNNIKSRFETIESFEENIKTTITYYKKVKNTIPIISQIIKFIRVYKLYVNSISNLIKDQKPDLIHANIAYPTGFWALYIKWKYKIPYVLTEHWTGYLPEDKGYHGFTTKIITKLTIKNAAFVLPVTNNLGNYMKNHGLLGNYKIIPNVVDNNTFYFSNSSKPKTLSFIHVSTLDDKQKNVSEIILAFYNFLKTNPDCKLTIVGDSTDKPNLEQQANALGILNKNIFFTGKKNPAELNELYNSHHALILFSRYENFPSVIAEAMTCGLPIISSNVGGIAEHVKNDFGILVNTQNEFLSALNQFSKNVNNYNSQLISSYAIENFSMKSVSDKLQSIYQQAIHV